RPYVLKQTAIWDVGFRKSARRHDERAPHHTARQPQRQVQIESETNRNEEREMSSNATVTATVQPTQALSNTELDRARLYLQQTKTQIVGAMRNLSEPQWNFKPGIDRWSIAEIVEHILVVQEHVLGPIRDQLATAPMAPADPDCLQVDDVILYQIP